MVTRASNGRHDPLSILLVWLGLLVFKLFVEPNHEGAAVRELVYYAFYNTVIGAFVGFYLVDRFVRRSIYSLLALSGLSLLAGTLVNEGVVEPVLFRTGPINFEGVYYGLFEAATAATLFILIRIFGALRAGIAEAPAKPSPRDSFGLGSREGGHFFVRIGSETRRISAADLIYVKAERDYAEIVCASGRHFVSESLKDVLDKAAPFGVVRVHKSFAVNLRRVDWLTGTEAGVGDRRVPVGRRYRQSLADAWGRGSEQQVGRARLALESQRAV